MPDFMETYLKLGSDRVRKYHLKAEEGWTIVPVEDWRDKFWRLDIEDAGSPLLCSDKEDFSKKVRELKICTVSSISKKVYVNEKHTMIAVNDASGWGRLLILDNLKRNYC